MTTNMTPSAHLTVKVVTRSSRDQIVGWLGNALKIEVAALPQKGRTNEAILAILADRLGQREDDLTGILTTPGRLPLLPLLKPPGNHEVFRWAAVGFGNQIQRLDQRYLDVLLLDQGRERLGGDFLEAGENQWAFL